MSMSYREALQRASSSFQNENLNPKIAEWLLFALHKNWTHLKWLDNFNLTMDPEVQVKYDLWVQRALKGEPYQYILGVQDFYGREFEVTPAVLIPRPETELLVEHSLALIKKLWTPDRRIIGSDIGTGSGAIAITLTLENKQIEMLGVDISLPALEMAKRNSDKHQASVLFRQSDLLQEIRKEQLKLDFIISNPPYIPFSEKEKVAENVLQYEPHLALFAKEEGLFCYQQIIQQSVDVVKRPGFLAFEIGQGQERSVTELILHTYPQAQVEVKKDLNGINRMVFAVLQ